MEWQNFITNHTESIFRFIVAEKIICLWMVGKLSENFVSVENIMGKGENTDYQLFFMVKLEAFSKRSNCLRWWDLAFNG